MSNKTKLVQRQPLTATVRPFQLLRGFSRPMMGTVVVKTSLTFRRSGRLLVDLETLACSDCEPHQASVSVGGGRQAGKRAGWARRRGARRSGRDTERQEAAGSPRTPAPRQLVLSSASRAFSITSCRYRQLKESAGGGGGGGGGGEEGMAIMAFCYEIELLSAILPKSFSPKTLSSLDDC